MSSKRRFVHNILVAPKFTVTKSCWIPWNDRIFSDNEVQLNQRAVVTKYFALGFRGSIEMKSVKPRQTADKYPEYIIYLYNEFQCFFHENELRNLRHIYTHTHTNIYIYISVSSMETWIFCLQSIYCKHWNNYIITVQHSPLPLVAQGHRLRKPYTQRYRSYKRCLIKRFRVITERPLCIYIYIYI